jgi:hypothetical protein
MHRDQGQLKPEQLPRIQVSERRELPSDVNKQILR